jgi:spore coat protein CotF
MGVLKSFETVLQPLHRDTSQINNITPQRLLIGLNQSPHHILIIQNGQRLCDDSVAKHILNSWAACHFSLIVASAETRSPQMIF